MPRKLVSKISERECYTLSETDTVKTASQSLHEKSVGCMPVVNKDKNVIGINLINACIGQIGPDDHFVDICVENIPYKACIHNKAGRHVMGRICMIKGDSKLNEHEPDNIKNNYFFPITLHEIKIKLHYKNIDMDTWEPYESFIHNSFVFRLTLLKNLTLLK